MKSMESLVIVIYIKEVTLYLLYKKVFIDLIISLVEEQNWNIFSDAWCWS